MLKLLINIAKKIPGPQDYSSIQSSVSIESEISAGQDPVAEAARLQDQAQQAVDRFLGITSAPRPTPPPLAPENPISTPTRSTSSQPPAHSASQPYHAGGQRRPAAQCSPAQVRYLRQLIDQGGHDYASICSRFNVSSIEEMRSREGSALIDELRGKSATSARS